MNDKGLILRAGSLYQGMAVTSESLHIRLGCVEGLAQTLCWNNIRFLVLHSGPIEVVFVAGPAVILLTRMVTSSIDRSS